MEEKQECLHCEINEVVQDYLDQHRAIDLPDVVSMVGESLVDLILVAPKEQWANLLAEAISQMGHVFLEKTGAFGNDTTH